MHTRCNEVCHPVREYSCLTRTSASDDEQRAAVVFNGVALVGIELRQVKCDALIVGHFASALVGDVARERTRIGSERGPRT